ncbi:MAG TPA: hypothetical protein VLS90_01660, partial [Thermodesulfobacteriota bacterium]|nr:hypothetical protein [Thermodesulfobacteriota bacterium]
KDPRRRSATSSNFTFPGHKEDTLVKKISERIASRLGCRVVVAAGLHWDRLSAREIRDVENLALEVANMIVGNAEHPKSRRAGATDSLKKIPGERGTCES